MLRRNVGGVDRAVRVALGVILVPTGLLLWGAGTGAGLVAAGLGAIALTTGIAGFCPPYVWLGISTARPRGWTALGAGQPETRAPGR